MSLLDWRPGNGDDSPPPEQEREESKTVTVYRATAWWPGCDPDGEPVVATFHDGNIDPGYIDALYRPDVTLTPSEERAAIRGEPDKRIHYPHQQVTLAGVRPWREYTFSWQEQAVESKHHGRGWRWGRVDSSQQVEVKEFDEPQ